MSIVKRGHRINNCYLYPLRLAAVLILFPVASAVAAETWSASSGRSFISFNTELLEDLGLTLAEVVQTETAPESDHSADGPVWNFSISNSNELAFEVAARDRVSLTGWAGALEHAGGFALRDNSSGRLVSFQNFEIVSSGPSLGSDESTPTSSFTFLLRNKSEGVGLQMNYAKARYLRADESLHIAAFDLTINEELAQSLGRPELADWIIGTGEVTASAYWIAGEVDAVEIPASAGDCTAPDAWTQDIFDLSYFGRVGTYPTGTIGLACGGTICNMGDCDIAWRSPMNEAHPGFAMALYREDGNRFEQIGTSQVKHAFLSLSIPGCGVPCSQPQNPADLGIGCSDTYGSGTNASRTYLAPRDEWLAFPGTWECTASHFADGEPDCDRRHNDSGHDGVDHRLRVEDVDLFDDATYVYDAVYLIPDDVNKDNNYAHRPTTFVRNGDLYNFSGAGPVVEGPAVRAWGADESLGSFPGNGQLLSSYKVTDIGGGDFAYEYALMNLDSDISVKRFSVPVNGSAISNIGFHDPNANELDDWQATMSGGEIVWETTDNPIVWGYMYNFRFVSDNSGVPGTSIAESSAGGSSVQLGTTVPGDVASVPIAYGDHLQLRSIPNPMTGLTTIHFNLTEAGPVSLEIYDGSGRRVRKLLSGIQTAGARQVDWDGTDDSGRGVAAGVYYYRLKAMDTSAVRSILFVH